MSQILRIALTYILHRKRQSVVSIFGVMMGVGFFIAISALMQGFQTFFIQKVIDVSPHVIIKDEYRLPERQPVALKYEGATIRLIGQKPKEELRGIRTAESIFRYLDANVKGAVYAPTMQGQVFLRYGSKDVSATAVGIDPKKERKVSNLERDLESGSLNALLSESNGIILGAGLAEKLGAEMGTKLTVISPKGVTFIMKVVGIFRTGIINLDNVESYVLLKKAQVLQDKINVINQVRLRLKDVEQAEALARTLEKRFAYRTESWKEQNKNIFSIFIIQNTIMYSTVGAILIVAGFGIYNIISTVVYEKSRDIAILKSIGFFESDIQWIYIFQGLIVGLIGTALGWALGYTLVTLMEQVRITMEGIIKADRLILHHTIYQYLISGALAIASAVFSAFLPARRAARVNPVDIIRGAA